jgi:pyrroline-5-carboxylate reductase
MNNLKKNKIGIIGMGNMGQSIYCSLQKVIPLDQIFVTDHNPSKLEICNSQQRCDNSLEVVDNSDLIFLAIKPSNLLEISKQLTGFLNKKLVVSVLAGVTLDKLKSILNCNRVIRAMPNLCIKEWKGVIGWIASDFVSVEEKQMVAKFFSTIGLEIEVDQEKKIDAITAIAGSGPAYFFYLTEILTKKAVEFGFNEIQARQLAEMTFIGSSALLEGEEKSSRDWKDSVTSKKGITEAALNYLKDHSFDQIFKEGVQQAYNKAEEEPNL